MHKDYRINKVNLSAFVYRLFHEDFSPIVETNIQTVYLIQRLERILHETVCKQMQIHKTSNFTAV